MPRVTPLRISLPSTLARSSLISKSANLPSPFPNLISAVRRRLAHPGRALDGRAQQALVHLLLVLARKRRAHRHILDRAVAVADRKPPFRKLNDLRHMSVLGRELGQLAHTGVEIQTREPRRVLCLEPGGTPLEEPLQLLLVQELDEVAGQLTMSAWEMFRGGRRERVHVLRPTPGVRLGVGDRREALRLQAFQVLQGGLLRNLEVRGDLAEGAMSSRLEEGENDLAPGIHGSHRTSFSTSTLK